MMKQEELSKLITQVLQTMLPPKMTLKLAQYVMAKVEEKASDMGINVVIAVSNEGARPVAVHCMDNAFIASYDVAVNKAYTVVALKMSTTTLKGLSQPEQTLYGIQFTNHGQIIIFGGGEPILYEGKVIGGLGVSGGTEEEDTKLAAYGKSMLEEALKCQLVKDK